METSAIRSVALLATLLLTFLFRAPSLAEPAAPPAASARSGPLFVQTGWNGDYARILEQEGEWTLHVVGEREHRRPITASCTLLVSNELDGSQHTYGFPRGGEVVVTESWILVAQGGLARGFPTPAPGGATLPPSPALDVHVFYESDVLKYDLEGSCWESAPFIPPCCDFVLVCGEGGPIADGCELTIDLVEGDPEVFSTECDSGLRFELCANGGSPAYRVTE